MSDKELRRRLADELSRKETDYERGDIAREHFEAGWPIYVGVPNEPDKIIEIHADGTQIKGEIIRRKFRAVKG